MKTKGIHHISMISGHPQSVIDFYTGVLGLRLIKQTLNYDNHETFHLYFGNNEGDIGTAITFFPSIDARDKVDGSGLVSQLSLEIPIGSMSFWEKRFDQFEIEYYKTKRFNQTYLRFKDRYLFEMELVEDQRGKPNTYTFNGVSSDVAIKGIYGVTLNSLKPLETRKLILDLGFKKTDDNLFYTRYQTDAVFGHTVDVLNESEPKGVMGKGSVHHVAFRSEVDEIEEWKDKLNTFHVTEIKDRQYFKSIYFRELGGIIIEIATDGPGFTVDETVENLGEGLKIPPHYREKASEIKGTYMPLFVREIDKLTSYTYTSKTTYEESIVYKQELARINELAKKQKAVGLTDLEKNEQDILRKSYAKRITGGLRNMVEGVKVVDPEGKEVQFTKKETNA